MRARFGRLETAEMGLVSCMVDWQYSICSRHRWSLAETGMAAEMKVGIHRRDRRYGGVESDCTASEQQQ